MKKIVFYILPLLLIAGCATTRESEPTITQTAPGIERPVKKQKPVATKPAEPGYATTAEPEPAGRTTDRHVIARTVEPEPKDLSLPPQKTGEPVTGGQRGWASLAEANENKLFNVYKGLDKGTVEIIMASAHNPYKREKINGTDGQIYEVLFYLTREPRKNKPITERQLTPVIFKNAEVIAMGNFQLKKLRNNGTLGRAKKASSRTK